MTDGSMSYKEIENAYKSWKGNIRKYNSYHIIKNMDKLFNDLFIKDWRIVYEWYERNLYSNQWGI